MPYCFHLNSLEECSNFLTSISNNVSGSSNIYLRVISNHTFEIMSEYEMMQRLKEQVHDLHIQSSYLMQSNEEAQLIPTPNVSEHADIQNTSKVVKTVANKLVSQQSKGSAISLGDFVPQTRCLPIETLGKQITELTLSELIDIYLAQIKSTVKDNTYKLYCNSFSKMRTDTFNLKITEINYFTLIDNFAKTVIDIKNSTKRAYMKTFQIFIAWCCRNGYFPPEFLRYIECGIKLKDDTEHRKALGCENFESSTDALKMLKKFFRSLWKNKTREQCILWFIHSVLCTRRVETIRAIKNFKPNQSYIEIKTKTLKNFCIPVTPILKSLLLEIQPTILKLTDRTAESWITNAIPKKFKKLMCPHGVRAFFRTTIDLMRNCKFSFEVKEAYLSHFVKTSCQKAYTRTDYLQQRYALQVFWIEWLQKAVPVKEQLIISTSCDNDCNRNHRYLGCNCSPSLR